MLVTASDLVYLQSKSVSPIKPPVGHLIDRRLGNGALRWTQGSNPDVQGGFLAPDGADLLLLDSGGGTGNTGTAAYVIAKATGQQVGAVTKLPANVLAAPAVVGPDSFIQLNPWVCISA